MLSRDILINNLVGLGLHCFISFSAIFQPYCDHQTRWRKKTTMIIKNWMVKALSAIYWKSYWDTNLALCISVMRSWWLLAAFYTEYFDWMFHMQFANHCLDFKDDSLLFIQLTKKKFTKLLSNGEENVVSGINVTNRM